MGTKQVAVWVIKLLAVVYVVTHYGEYQAKKNCQKFLRNASFGSLVNYAILYLKSYQTG